MMKSTYVRSVIGLHTSRDKTDLAIAAEPRSLSFGYAEDILPFCRLGTVQSPRSDMDWFDGSRLCCRNVGCRLELLRELAV